MDSSPPSPFSPSSSNFSLSHSSLISTTSSSRRSTANSVKASPEYRSLRQQYFHLQSLYSSLKLTHERDSIAFTTKKAQLLDEIHQLKLRIEEIEKDQIFILNSEKDALESVKSLQEENLTIKATLTSQVKSLQDALLNQQNLNFSLQTDLIRQKSSEPATLETDQSEFNHILEDWKNQVITLTTRANSLDAENESLKSQLNSMKPGSVQVAEDPEILRQNILSTYVSLEAAQSVLVQRRAEADRLAQRIGNVKVLEEKYRDALLRIKRLEVSSTAEKTQSRSNSSSPPPLSESHESHSSSASDLKLIQLTQEIGALKESLTMATLNYSTLQSDLEASKVENSKIRSELDESTRTIQKLLTTIKVKESTVSSLKEQLDSTVNLLTETLKKK